MPTINLTYVLAGSETKESGRLSAGEDTRLYFTPNTPGSISGMSFRVVIADTVNDPALYSEADVTVVSAANGTFYVDVAALDSFDWATGIYSLELRRVDSGYNTVLRRAALSVAANPLASGDPPEYAGATITINGTTQAVDASPVFTVSAGTWGSITGTLTDQTDLVSALALKAPLASPTFTGTVTIPSGASISGYLTTVAAAAAYQPLDADLTAIASLTTDSFGRGLLPLTTAGAVRTYIGAGTSSFDGAYSSLSGIPSTFAPTSHASSHQNGGSDEIATATAGANAIPKAGAGGTLAAGWIPDLSATYLTVSAAAAGYQPLDADLTTLAGITIAANTFPARSSSGAAAAKTITDFGLSLVDDTDAATARGTLGGTTVGQAIFTATNPGAITFLRANADNTVSLLSASDFRTAIGAGTGSGDALTSGKLSQFAATTSAELAGVISDETGSGALVFANSPTLTTPNIGSATGSISGNAGTATALATPRAIYGNNFDGSAALTQVIASTYGGTGNGFTKFSGPTTTERTFTLPNASVALLYEGGPLGTPNAGTLTNCTGLPTAGLVDAAVTLAKMANLAQDQFIGRTTASTGVPETATITAAARTVLDDTTVSAMVDTLGGASALGSGGIVRGTSPTITTPTIAKLANLTSNGFVKTSGGDGTLGVDTSTYLTANQTITLSGDVSGSGTTGITATLATVNSNVGSFGGASSVPTVTVNAKGLITAASATTVVAPAGTLTGTTLNSTVVTSSLTSVGTIGTGVWQGTIIGTAYGGTGVDNSTGGTANTFWARPNGATGAATYRAIVAADIPTLNQNTTGSAATLTTGRTIAMTGDVTWTSPAFDGSGNVTAAGTIANAAVTLAKMADLAQDQFIVRTTASTGVPQTATCTAAARTVLDDTTVAAMVDTLGGASSTGSGGLVRATSPTLVTPALGTPSSGTLTNCTGLPVAGGGTGLASATAYAVLCGGTTSTGAFQSIASVGTSGHVLTSNGAGALPTFQASSGTSKLVQRVVTTYTTEFSTTATIPLDNTKPQSSEGAEVTTVSITPTSASNKITVYAVANTVSADAAIHVIYSLFRDAGADAIFATATYLGGSSRDEDHGWQFTETAPGTSTYTYKWRAGPNANTLYINKNSTSSLFNGLCVSYLIAEEWIP